MLHATYWKKAAGTAVLIALLSCGTALADSAKPAQPGAVQTPGIRTTRCAQTKAAEDKQIIEDFLKQFRLLNQIPRPSGHMEKISNFLADWARKQGLKPVQDKKRNVIFDVPATNGKENLPLCILQAHIDMVCAANEGVVFHPMTDPIKVIHHKADNTLTADGTSLGADDGAGVAMIMNIVAGKMEHGPLRVIFTVDEETDMSGVLHIDKKQLEGARYLINIDSEKSDTVTISSAAGASVFVKNKVASQKPAGEQAVVLTLFGLAGGHSGIDIHKGRLNAIRELAGLLKDLPGAGISCETAEFTGGTASNAIPLQAAALLVIRQNERQALEQMASTRLEAWKKAGAGVEDKISLTVKEAPMPSTVIGSRDVDGALTVATGLINGVYTMTYEGLVESSSNLGMISLSPQGFTATTYVRSSADDKLQEILQQQTNLIKQCGFSSTVDYDSDPWPYKPDSKLRVLTQRVYQELNGESIKVEALHAALECGTFSKLNPSLDIISIGPDIHNVHSPKETLYLNSIPKTWNLLKGILARLE